METGEILDKLNKFKDKLRSLGMKVTPQRLAIFEVLAKTKRHPDAESVFAEIRKVHPEISHATVYSTLKLFQKKGIIQEIGSWGDIRRFDGNPKPHPHLICIDCNKIEDLDEINIKDLGRLESFVAKKTKYKLVRNGISFYGYCPDCKR